MQNNVLKHKVSQNELYSRYKKGVVMGALTVLYDVLKRAEDTEKTVEEKFNDIVAYCKENKERITRENKNESKEWWI